MHQGWSEQLSLYPSHPSCGSPKILVEEDWAKPRAWAAPGPGGSECFSTGPCTDLTWTLRFVSEVHPLNSVCSPQEPLSHTKCQVNTQRTKCKGKGIPWCYEKEYTAKKVRKMFTSHNNKGWFTKLSSGTRLLLLFRHQTENCSLCKLWNDKIRKQTVWWFWMAFLSR